MRRVDAFTSPSKVATEKVLATHSRPGASAAPSRTDAARSHQARSTPAAASGAATVHARRHPQRARACHRVERVVHQVGPHLVELAGVRLDPGDVGAVLAHDRDTVAQLVPQHRQRAVEAVRHVDPL
ncbi:MAG TPA: hypothetical protein VFD04_11695, partial [Actinomycetes bacterium]|nr:hypothetical protein [Actinomycetes bacterium]